MENITYTDFAKLDLRVAQIKKVENIDGADKLYKLTVSLDPNEKEVGKKPGFLTRTICAGIKQYYKPEELKNKKIIIIANLEPRTLKGIESQGMLLAAGSKETNQCVLLTVEKDIESGTKIS